MDMLLLEVDGVTVMEDDKNCYLPDFSTPPFSLPGSMSSRLRRIKRFKASDE